MRLIDHIAAAVTLRHDDEAALLGDDVRWDATFTPAAVLIAIVDCPEPRLILTQRPDHMRNHAGQIAFPGGRVDESDSDAVAAALREAQEEIGLPPDRVRLLGTSDTYRTGTGFSITPVIGLISPGVALEANPHEVSAVFDVPLDYVFNPQNQLAKSGQWRGKMRDYYEIVWQEHRIWGATAGIIVNLTRRLS